MGDTKEVKGAAAVKQYLESTELGPRPKLEDVAAFCGVEVGENERDWRLRLLIKLGVSAEEMGELKGTFSPEFQESFDTLMSTWLAVRGGFAEDIKRLYGFD